MKKSKWEKSRKAKGTFPLQSRDNKVELKNKKRKGKEKKSRYSNRIFSSLQKQFIDL